MLKIKLIACFKKEWAALCYAARGVFEFLSTEPKTMIYTPATFAVIVAALLLHLTNIEWILLTGAIAAVWAAEMFNTCIEEIMNFIHPAQHPKIKRIKDISAGAVLLTAMASAIAGAIIFLPKILAHVQQ